MALKSFVLSKLSDVCMNRVHIKWLCIICICLPLISMSNVVAWGNFFLLLRYQVDELYITRMVIALSTLTENNSLACIFCASRWVRKVLHVSGNWLFPSGYFGWLSTLEHLSTNSGVSRKHHLSRPLIVHHPRKEVRMVSNQYFFILHFFNLTRPKLTPILLAISSMLCS